MSDTILSKLNTINSTELTNIKRKNVVLEKYLSLINQYYQLYIAIEELFQQSAIEKMKLCDFSFRCMELEQTYMKSIFDIQKNYSKIFCFPYFDNFYCICKSNKQTDAEITCILLYETIPLIMFINEINEKEVIFSFEDSSGKKGKIKGQVQNCRIIFENIKLNNFPILFKKI